MKPYYQESGVTIYHGKCEKVMPLIDKGSIGLVACDLPYGQTAAKWDSQVDFDMLWNNYRRVLSADGAVVLTATQPFSSQLVCSNPKWFRHEWVWRKNRASNFLNAKSSPLRVHETVLVFAPNAARYFPQKTNGHTPVNFARRRANSSPLYRSHGASVNNAGATDRFPLTVQDFDCVDNISAGRFHPTQKPVALFEYFIRSYSLAGETVLDNCAGSGTTAVAAKNCGRKCILIEQEERFCEIAAKRLAQEVLQL